MAASCTLFSIARNSRCFLFIKEKDMIENYITVKEAAEKWELSERELKIVAGLG